MYNYDDAMYNKVVMGSLSEAHATELTKPDYTDSLYVALLCSPQTQRRLVLEIMAYKIPVMEGRTLYDVVSMFNPKINKPSEYHTTLIYSRKSGAKIFQRANEIVPYITSVKAFSGKLTFFGTSCVLLLNDSNGQLADFNNQFMELGGTSDFPDYNPHITLFSFEKDTGSPNKVLLDLIENHMPKFNIPITYSKIVSEPLDTEWNKL